MTNQQLSDALRLLELRGVTPPRKPVQQPLNFDLEPDEILVFGHPSTYPEYRRFSKDYFETPIPISVKEPNEPK